MIDNSAPIRPRAVNRLATATCSWLICAPPTLPADTRLKRVADRVLPRPGWPATVYFAGVAALLGLAGHLPTRPGLAVIALACLGGGGWCAVNYWRCRHAHCLITGVGWLALAAPAVLGSAVGHSLLGNTEQLVFLGVLVAGVVFEATTYLTRGSYALTSTAEARHAVPPQNAAATHARGAR